MALTVVLGLGESGLACTRWLAHAGTPYLGVDDRASPPAPQNSTPLNPANLRYGVHFAHPESFLTGASEIIVSPGLSPARLAAVRAYAHSQQIPVHGELALFARALAQLRRTHQYQPKVIAITGTNGKTTTTQLTAALLQSAGQRAQVAGNVSPALLSALLSATSEPPDQWPEVWVLELSSFQLYDPHTLPIDAATILNLTQDHLDWHPDMADYARAKLAVFTAHTRAVLPSKALQGELAPYLSRVLTQREKNSIAWISDQTPTSAQEWGVATRGDRAGVLQQGSTPLIECADLRLHGRHNYLNALTALALCEAIGVPTEACLSGLRNYAGEAHRCQHVATIAGVDYIDDSKGTNVGATLAALQSAAAIVGARGALQWVILGGEGKGQDFSPLRQMRDWHIGGVALIGRAQAQLETTLADCVPTLLSQTLEAAVPALQARARAGDQILLSPACASFDQFRDYKHRGECFVAAVQALASAESSA